MAKYAMLCFIGLKLYLIYEKICIHDPPSQGFSTPQLGTSVFKVFRLHVRVNVQIKTTSLAEAICSF